MATIHNNLKCLLTGPAIPGHPVPQWLPGMNPLSGKYWDTARRHGTVKVWLRLGWVKPDLDDDMPDPGTPPTDEQLATLTDREIEEAMHDKRVPAQWHPVFEAEQKRRAAKKVRDRLAPDLSAADPHAHKSLKGLTVEKALPVIANEKDLAVLQTWAKADDRKSIAEAIEARTDELLLTD